MAFELIVRGGKVVTAAGSRRADIAVRGGRIAEVAPDLPVESAERVIDADGLLVLPGVVDVHTHTRLASDAEPDRFFQDSVAAAFGGTTTFLSFNNPGTGSPRTGSLTADIEAWRQATDSDSAVDYGLSLVLTPAEQDALSELPAVIDAGVPTVKAFMVYDFGLSEAALFAAVGAVARAGGMLEVHCEQRDVLEANTRRLLDAGRTGPRFHAASRPPLVEADGLAQAVRLAQAADAPLYVVHLSSAAALEQLRLAQAAGLPVLAETCPHYLALDDSRYELPGEQAARFVISPPLRSPADRDALWQGLADGALALVSTDHVPDRVSVEKQGWREAFDRISNGAPGIETLLTVVHTLGVAQDRITLERLVDLRSAPPPRLFGLKQKGAIEAGRDADLVLFDPGSRWTITAAGLHHSSDYTPYEGLEAVGAVRSVLVRGVAVVRDGQFVGRRGFGHFVERRLEWR